MIPISEDTFGKVLLALDYQQSHGTLQGRQLATTAIAVFLADFNRDPLVQIIRNRGTDEAVREVIRRIRAA
jgi:hypothetical protein